jgi:hexosaminidase
MMQRILDEIIEIFPSEYIHIGGDEATKRSWGECEDCQRRMREEGLENVDELQSYMIHRIEEYLNARGRQIIGWDEILEGGLAPNATVMSWRGEDGGRTAAEAGHKVVMSPHGYCYIDAPQDAPPTQPEAIGGYLPLEKVYSYDPAPKDMPESVSSYILGVQGNLWAEFIPTDEHYEMMLWPRAIAIAEVGWSQPNEKEYGLFRIRAIDIIERMMKEGYHPFDLKNEIGERPESLQPIKHLARGKAVTYNLPSRYYAPQYGAAGDATLTDGLRGTWTYADGRWQGFLGRGGVDITIDMGEVTHIESIAADFMQYCGPGVFMPCLVEIAISMDGEHYTKIADIEHEVKVEDVPSFKSFGWEGSAEARYIRYKAHRSKFSGFLFIDEVVVK